MNFIARPQSVSGDRPNANKQINWRPKPQREKHRQEQTEDALGHGITKADSLDVWISRKTKYPRRAAEIRPSMVIVSMSKEYIPHVDFQDRGSSVRCGIVY